MSFRRRASSAAERERVEALWAGSFVPKASWPTAKAFVARLKDLDEDKLPVAKFQKLVTYVVKDLTATLNEETRAGLAKDDILSDVFSGLYCLLSVALRFKVDGKTFTKDVSAVGVPKLYAAPLVELYCSKLPALIAAAGKQRVELPTITGTNWRVDVTISTTALSRVFSPSVTMQLTLSDGRIRTFECSVEEFHTLRYNVAKTLKAVQDLRQHPTLVRDL